jgi:hypothetical protein
MEVAQRLRRGFLWMLGFALLLALPNFFRHLPHNGPGPLAVYACWTLLAPVLSVLPFTFYRMTSPHRDYEVTFAVRDYLSGLLGTISVPLDVR